ncbi:MAG: hypothetical protein ACRBFS_00855 [Aureispira sp.]
MSNHQLLDEKLPNYTSTPLSSSLLGLAWLGLGSWLLYLGWDAYQIALDGSLGLFKFIYYSYGDAYHWVVQGPLTLLIGLLYVNHNKQAIHFAFGALVAGTTFHFIDLLQITVFSYSILTFEHAIAGLLIFIGWQRFDSTLIQKMRANRFLLLTVIVLIMISELAPHQDLVLLRAIGILFFWRFLWKISPFSLSRLVQEKRWYYCLFPFIGTLPFLLMRFFP